MRKFLFDISLFCAVLLALGAGIEALLLFRPNYYSYKRNQLENHLNDIEVLLLGNSHIEEGLNPSVIGHHTFNMAMAGKDPIYDVELVKKYVPQMKKLKILLMPLDYDYFVLGRYKVNPNDKRDRSLEKDFIRNKKCMYYKYLGLRVDDFWHWSEFLNSKDKFLNRFWSSEKDIINCDSLGYVNISLERRRKDWESLALPPLTDKTIPRDDLGYNQLLNYYGTIAKVAKDKQVKLLFVDTPMYKTYQSFVDKSISEERKTFVKELNSKYGNVYYFEYMNDPGFGTDDFADASHLSEYGAIKFSNIIREVIEQLL